jgi:molybdopterin molybdotransferase
MLARLVEQAGCEVIELGIAEDRIEAVEASLSQARQEEADLLISSAGVSVGAFDHVRTVIERSGALEFWRVNIRPGKPFAFGQYFGLPVFGLPGNPVSAFIGFQVFVRPVLDYLAGRPVERPFLRASLEHAIESDGRESYLRAILTQSDQGWQARLTGHQGSGNLRSLVQANALIIIPSLVKSLPSGAEVAAWLLND